MTNEWRDMPTMADVSAAQAAGDEIEIFVPALDKWEKWNASVWFYSADYRARPAQPKMKKIKMLAWYDGIWLQYANEEHSKLLSNTTKWARAPAEDKEIEVPDDN